MKLIGRIIAISAAAALTFIMFGCSSPDTPSNASSSASSSAESSAVESSSSASSTSASESAGTIKEPPIPCTQPATFKNVSIMVPEDWTVEPGFTGKFLKFSNDEKTLDGYLEIMEEDSLDLRSDEELEKFAEDSFEDAANKDVSVEKDFKVEHNGDLSYIIVPFKQKYAMEGQTEKKDWYGYSLCGYDNETIIMSLSSSSNKAKIQDTFKWIMENIQVS